MPNKRRQHVVPRFYLKNFSIRGSGKTIGLFNLQSNRLIKEAKLKTQAYKKNFYGVDTTLEDSLGLIESSAAPVINEIIQHDALPAPHSVEHLHILV